MCAKPQTSAEAVVYKSLAPCSVSTVRMPSFLAPRARRRPFVEEREQPEIRNIELDFAEGEFYEQD